MKEDKTASGIVLKAIPFQESGQILTVYTKELGLAKFCAMSALNQKKAKGTKTSPLNEVELTYCMQNSELFKVKDSFLLHPHLKLRERLTTLQAGCDMIESIESSQPLLLANPPLYDLFSRLLKALPEALDPFTLAAALRLKILYIDGWLNLETLSTENSALMRQLAVEKSLKTLLGINLGPSFLEQTKRLMRALIRHD